jgi:hypothetical protein
VLIVAAYLTIVPAAILSHGTAQAATKTIPPTAFKTFLNYDPAKFAIGQASTSLIVFATPSPLTEVLFWAPVGLPAGARVTRVRYWYGDAEGRGTKLIRTSFRMGMTDVATMAKIETADTQTNLVKTSTEVIAQPEVAAGEQTVLTLSLPLGGVCGGVKIDYQP